MSLTNPNLISNLIKHFEDKMQKRIKMVREIKKKVKLSENYLHEIQKSQKKSQKIKETSKSDQPPKNQGTSKPNFDITLLHYTQGFESDQFTKEDLFKIVSNNPNALNMNEQFCSFNEQNQFGEELDVIRAFRLKLNNDNFIRNKSVDYKKFMDPVNLKLKVAENFSKAQYRLREKRGYNIKQIQDELLSSSVLSGNKETLNKIQFENPNFNDINFKSMQKNYSVKSFKLKNSPNNSLFEEDQASMSFATKGNIFFLKKNFFELKFTYQIYI